MLNVVDFEIVELETVDAPSETAFWIGVGVGVIIGIALC